MTHPHEILRPIDNPCWGAVAVAVWTEIPNDFAGRRLRAVRMNYLPWAVLALVAYSFVAPLMREATSGSGAIPSDVAALVANAMLVVGTVVVIALTDQRVTTYLRHPDMRLVAAAGVCLTVGILAYYRALARGPVSIVAPIFALFLVGASVVGVVALDEALTLRKAAGMVLAVLAIVLVAGE